MAAVPNCCPRLLYRDHEHWGSSKAARGQWVMENVMHVMQGTFQGAEGRVQGMGSTQDQLQ